MPSLTQWRERIKQGKWMYRTDPTYGDWPMVVRLEAQCDAALEALAEAQGKLGKVQRVAENYAGQAGREPLFDAGMIAAGEGILAILGENE